MAANIKAGIYAILNPATTRFLTADGSWAIVNSPGHLDNSPNDQLFLLSQVKGYPMYFYLINIETGLCLHIGSNGMEGSPIVQRQQSSAFPSPQIFGFSRAGTRDDTTRFYISNTVTGYAVTIKNDQTQNKYQVSAWQMYKSVPEYNQQFVFIPMNGAPILQPTLWSGLSQSMSSVWSCFGGKQAPQSQQQHRSLTAPTHGENRIWATYEAHRSAVVGGMNGKWEKYIDETHETDETQESA